MNQKHQRIQQGVRFNRYSGSKRTNWTRFKPGISEVDKLFWPYLLHRGPAKRLTIAVRPIHRDFVRPVERADIEARLSSVPAEFLEGLERIWILGGSSKQAKVWRWGLYGLYRWGHIFLFPVARCRLHRVYRKGAAPHRLEEYRRAGAEIEHGRRGVVVKLSREALRRFYLDDVLMHEIGHHVDRHCRKSRRKAEGFAEWFAAEYGFRRPLVRGAEQEGPAPPS